MSLDLTRQVLESEANSIKHLAAHLTEEVETAIRWMLECKGRVITCGIGKSGHIARKTAGTLSSTGTPSFFLHAAEAVHGDLGMVTDQDIVLMYTHSGETDELVRLFPSLRANGARVVLITGRPNSSAGHMADLVLDTKVHEEVCPHNLAPTTSTTVMLALSDALAIAVMDRRSFTQDDFAKFHPSGALGKRLLLRVKDVMRTGEDLALAYPNTPILDVMRSITQAGAGAACVLDDGGHLVGFISDGDLRRHFLNSGDPLKATAQDLMSRNLWTIEEDLLAVEALEVFQNLPKKVGEMPVVNSEQRVVGLVMLKDLLRTGIV